MGAYLLQVGWEYAYRGSGGSTSSGVGWEHIIEDLTHPHTDWEHDALIGRSDEGIH